ncbi:hypothetical protein BDR05DRAFT_883749, partial [Suillus weaverae]
IIVNILHHELPNIFLMAAKDGSMFKCSDSWVKAFLYDHLQYTIHQGTRAAQKLPPNVDNQFLPLSLTIRDDVIPYPEFLVNIDQTNVIYQPAKGCTYEHIGLKQVAIVGQEEKKCAFTLLVGISAAGDLLAFHIVHDGKSKHSLPSPNAPCYNEALELKFQFVFSNIDTYCATFETMCTYVTGILVPFWIEKKQQQGVPLNQPCILQLNCWSVHCSLAFRTWLDINYEWIHYQFVPAGTTGVAQPCDVGIQRPLKLAIKELQHEDIVTETLTQLMAGRTADEI